MMDYHRIDAVTRAVCTLKCAHLTVKEMVLDKRSFDALEEEASGIAGVTRCHEITKDDKVGRLKSIMLGGVTFTPEPKKSPHEEAYAEWRKNPLPLLIYDGQWKEWRTCSWDNQWNAWNWNGDHGSSTYHIEPEHVTRWARLPE